METSVLEPTHFIDAVIIGVYLLLTFGFGIFAKRLLHSDTKNEEGYFLAGRKVPGWVGGLSYAVTLMNSNCGPVYCGLAVVVGLAASWFYLSQFSLAMLIFGMLFAVRWRQMGISTGPEFFALRFGGQGGKFVRCYSSLFGTFISITACGAGLLGIHMIFSPVFGIESKTVTLAIVLPVLMMYVWISGFAGVLVTDVLQCMIMIGANLFLIVFVLSRFGGPGGLVSALQTTHPAEAKSILSVLPVPGHRVFGPLTVLAWFIVPTIGAGGGVGSEGQRIFSCRTSRESARVCVWAQMALFAMLLVLTLPVLAVIVDHPELYHADPVERETAYGLMLADYLPAGFLGLALAALLASMMSTVDSLLNYGAQTLLNDVYRPLLGAPSEARALWIGRLFMFVVLACAIAVVYFSKSLYGLFALLIGLFGSTAAFNWGQWWWWRVNLYSWISAFVGGPIIYFSLGFLLKQWDWWQLQLDQGESAAQSMGMLQAVIALALTTVIWILVTLVTSAQSLAVLKNFYRKARPMGMWAPVRAAIEQETPDLAEPPRLLMGSGFASALLGSSWLILAVLSLAELFVGRYVKAVVLASLAVLLALCFKRVFNWHVNRMLMNEENMEEESPSAQRTIAKETMETVDPRLSTY